MRPLEAVKLYKIEEYDFVKLHNNLVGKILFLNNSTFTIMINGVMYEYFYTGKPLLSSYSVGELEIICKLSKENHPEYYL